MKFDEVLSIIGDFGRYQRVYFVLLCSPLILGAYISLSVLFILDIPAHRCSLGENDTYSVQSESHAHLVNMSIPWGNEKGQPIRSACRMYTQPMDGSHDNNETTKCTSWVFDKSNYESTVTEKFSIVCDNRILRSHSNMASFVGQVVGMLFSGYVSDRFGRRPMMMGSATICIGSFLAITFVESIHVFMILRAVVNLTMLTLLTTAFVSIMEFTGPSKRVFVSTVRSLFWIGGLFLLALFAYFIRDWWTLQLTLASQTMVYIFFIWLMPESPRWLISKNRMEDAKAHIRKIAAFNKVHIQEEVLENLQEEKTVKQGEPGILTDWLSSCSLVTMSLIICFNWLVCSMVYYGLSLNVQNLSGNIYFNFTISTIVEAASYLTVLLLLDRLGRKLLLCGAMFLGGLSCIGTIFPVLYGTKANEWITILLAMIGKFGASGAFAIIYLYTAELYPTVIRNTGIGLSSFCARIGGVISPYIADLVRCSLGENDTYSVQSESHAHLVNMSIPWGNEKGQPIRSACRMYTQPMDGSHDNNETTKCTSWVFDKSNYESTVTEKFSIVCDNRILRSHSNMASFVGQVVGMLFSGYVSDRFGRRPMMMGSATICIGSFLAITFVESIHVFMILRAVVNLTMLTLLTTAFVSIMEFTGPSKRVFVSTVRSLFWIGGLFLLALFAYFIRDWWTLQLTLASQTMVYIFFIWLMPESPRWLISKNRMEDAKAHIRKIAAFNKVHIQEEVLENLQEEKTVKQGEPGILTDWLSSCSLVTMSLIICFNWLVCSMVYYGLSLNVQNLSGNIYFNFTISTIVEAASYLTVLLLLDRLGRKLLLCGAMFLGGLSCIGTIFPVLYGTKANEWITILLAMIGKFGASGAFAIIYLYTAELYPTVIRNTGIGLSSFCARIGGVISPYIADLGIIVGGDLKVALPLIVFGVFSVTAGILSFKLPETMGRTLPETIQDLQDFHRNKERRPYVAVKLTPTEQIEMDENKSMT